jgi:two-component system chemotaxis response regulator CheY
MNPASIFDKSLRILLVDDMPAMRSILRGFLHELGFNQVTEAEDGDLAWQTIQQASGQPNEAFGLIIADWNMPGLSGVDLLRAVRNFAPTRDLPFLMITAQGSDSRINEATRAGVTRYIVKPFDSNQLREKITEIFSG